MISFKVFNGRGAVSEEEIELGTPSEMEAKNLPFHVSRCALRYRNFTKRQAEHSAELTQIKLLLALGIIILAAISETGRNVLGSMIGVQI